MIPSGTAVTLPRTELRRPQPHQISESGVLGASGHCTRAVPHSTPLGEMEEHHYGRSEMTSKAAGVVFKRGIFGSLRRAALIAMVAGAGASLALMLRAGHRNPSRILLMLFALWVLSPFMALVLANVVSKRWSALTRVTLHCVMLVLTLGSLAVYGDVALGPPRARTAFVFVVVPPASWLLIAVVVPIAALIWFQSIKRLAVESFRGPG